MDKRSDGCASIETINRQLDFDCYDKLKPFVNHTIVLIDFFLGFCFLRNGSFYSMNTKQEASPMNISVKSSVWVVQHLCEYMWSLN